MKALNFIDLIVQTIVLGFVALCTVGFSIAGQLGGITLVAMYGALLLGPWQFVSSLVTTLSKGLYLKWRKIHLLSSIGYFVLFGVGAYFMQDMISDGLVRAIAAVLGFGIPVVLAVFYYYITIKSFQLARAATRTIEVKA